MFGCRIKDVQDEERSGIHGGILLSPIILQEELLLENSMTSSVMDLYYTYVSDRREEYVD